MPDRQEATVRPLVEADLPQADRIFRSAFGAFLGVEDPFGDADLITTRWRSDPAAALAADIDGGFVGSCFVTNWGSVGFFGPLTVTPARWDQAIGQQLLDGVMDLFEAWGTRHAGLFTFSQSPKHVGLYQRYGFWPRFLTAVMSAPVHSSAPEWPHRLVSEVDESGLAGVLASVADLTGSIYDGLDVGVEIRSVRAQGLGDTVVVGDLSAPDGVAVCHIGAGTEAGGGACYMKFAGVRPGPDAPATFGRLLDACHHLASTRGAHQLVAGANAGRPLAWTALRERGFRTGFQGVAMHRPNDDGYNTPQAFVVDDWR